MNIYFITGYLGWGLEYYTKSQHPVEYEQIVSFLGAKGPLVATALKHSLDPAVMFEYPIKYLPVSL